MRAIAFPEKSRTYCGRFYLAVAIVIASFQSFLFRLLLCEAVYALGGAFSFQHDPTSNWKLSAQAGSKIGVKYLYRCKQQPTKRLVFKMRLELA